MEKSLLHINPDAFASGQMESKLWLCRELEKLDWARPQTIWILGGWYGLLATLLFSRERIPIAAIRSFDIDESANRMADALNENWVWREWRFKAFARDANRLEYKSGEFGPAPNLVINTSTEHFQDSQWFRAIPAGTRVALQSNNMPHDTHVDNVGCTAGLAKKFPLQKELFRGSIRFNYPSWGFDRFLVIGEK